MKDEQVYIVCYSMCSKVKIECVCKVLKFALIKQKALQRKGYKAWIESSILTAEEE